MPMAQVLFFLHPYKHPNLLPVFHLSTPYLEYKTTLCCHLCIRPVSQSALRNHSKFFNLISFVFTESIE